MTSTLASSPMVESQTATPAVVSDIRTPAFIETRPRWRGVMHEYAFAVSPAAGLVLLLSATTTRAAVAAALFAGTMTLMLGASAFNHRTTGASHRSALLFERLDHTAINLHIGGTWASIALLALEGPLLIALTAFVWGGAVVASSIKILCARAPRLLTPLAGLALGWAGIVALSEMATGLRPAGTALFLLGGISYTAGALVYVFRRPDPAPAVFGFHEVFHGLVLGGVACHYATVALLVVP